MNSLLFKFIRLELVCIFMYFGDLIVTMYFYRKHQNPMTTLNSVTLERVDQLAKMKQVDAPDLKYALGIFKEARKYQVEDEKSENTTYKEWSIFSDFCSSINDFENDSEDDFSFRLKEVEQGIKLRRRSTLVSDLGFKKENV